MPKVELTSWLRARQRALAVAALLAMALQFVGTFAHVHAPKTSGVSAAVQFGASAAAAFDSTIIVADQITADAGQRPARHDGDLLCPLCLAGHLVASAIAASAPQLALSVAYAIVERSLPVVQSPSPNIATFFWSRGPPQS